VHAAPGSVFAVSVAVEPGAVGLVTETISSDKAAGAAFATTVGVGGASAAIFYVFILYPFASIVIVIVPSLSVPSILAPTLCKLTMVCGAGCP